MTTTRPTPLRVVVPEDVTCTLCLATIGDRDDYEADVIGNPVDDDFFLLLRCMTCAVHTTVTDGGSV